MSLIRLNAPQPAIRHAIITLSLLAATIMGTLLLGATSASAATVVAEISGAGSDQRLVRPVRASVSSVGPANPVPDRASATADLALNVLRAEAIEWGGGPSFPVTAFASLQDTLDFTNNNSSFIFNLQILIDGYSDPFAWQGPTLDLPEGGLTTTFLNSMIIVNEKVPNVQGSGVRIDYTHTTTTILTPDPVLGGIIDVDTRDTFNERVIRQPVIGGGRQSYVGQHSVTYIRNPSSIGYEILVEIPLMITAGQDISFDIFGSLAPFAAGATAHGARADMSNSMRFGYVADPGISFTSGSGVFLRDAGPLTPMPAVPLPASVFGFMTAFLMLGMLRRFRTDNTVG